MHRNLLLITDPVHVVQYDQMRRVMAISDALLPISWFGACIVYSQGWTLLTLQTEGYRSRDGDEGEHNMQEGGHDTLIRTLPFTSLLSKMACASKNPLWKVMATNADRDEFKLLRISCAMPNLGKADRKRLAHGHSEVGSTKQLACGPEQVTLSDEFWTSATRHLQPSRE